MEVDRLDQARGPLTVAAALAAVAGFLDAHLFQRVADVFVANMSGNVVLLGIGIGDLSGPRIAAPATSLVAFAAGMAGATLVQDRRLKAGRPLRPDVVVAGEVVVLGLLGLLLATVEDTGTIGDLGALGYLAVATAAVAMGAQTAVLRRVGTVAVATTYESGAVVRLSEDLVLARVDPDPDERARHRRVLVVVGTVVASYCGGAAVAAALGTAPVALVVPGIALLGCAVTLRVHVAHRGDPTAGAGAG